jgi:ATP-dependent Lon protease
VLDRMADMAPREMRRAWMTAFGNAKLDGRDVVELRDLPEPSAKKGAIGFVQ